MGKTGVAAVPGFITPNGALCACGVRVARKARLVIRNSQHTTVLAPRAYEIPDPRRSTHGRSDPDSQNLDMPELHFYTVPVLLKPDRQCD